MQRFPFHEERKHLSFLFFIHSHTPPYHTISGCQILHDMEASPYNVSERGGTIALNGVYVECLHPVRDERT
ncbi:hypothetical protein QSI_2507 [Clostridioides difficile P28]|nr:hypothetical protein QSI_2507 [Clostridioides difficile P28]MCR0163860.1 hypothetical protein [[Clostridium] innocuum]MCR0400163.1 hypothetical protein [[Clostridium] innocuum]MCR0449651.1 hypothetical protein [[Clostridium] innocuum]